MRCLQSSIEKYDGADLNLRNRRLATMRTQYTDGEIKMIAYDEAKIPKNHHVSERRHEDTI